MYTRVQSWVTTFVSTKKQGKFRVKNRAKTGHFSKISSNFRVKFLKKQGKNRAKIEKSRAKTWHLKMLLS